MDLLLGKSVAAHVHTAGFWCGVEPVGGDGYCRRYAPGAKHVDLVLDRWSPRLPGWLSRRANAFPKPYPWTLVDRREGRAWRMKGLVSGLVSDGRHLSLTIDVAGPVASGEA